ncbi:hypothetical protein DVH05_014943 [Phytophthora capsici]|nr:hypothetical protein DVH05_014943 [Phytophthora capsici]
MKKYFVIFQDSAIHFLMNEHTHAENHRDYKTHVVNNGAGGGIQKEPASGIPEFAPCDVDVCAYGGQEYGFMFVEASEDGLKLQYHTADDSLPYEESFKASTVGDVATKQCWYIPLDGRTYKCVFDNIYPENEPDPSVHNFQLYPCCQHLSLLSDRQVMLPLKVIAQVQQKIRNGLVRSCGVNLGGWLVAEG